MAKKKDSEEKIKNEAAENVDIPEKEESAVALSTDASDSKVTNAGEETTYADDTANNQKEEYVDYCLPFVPGKEMGDSQTVTVNGKNYQVRYGEQVRIPIAVKEILEDMLLSQKLIKRKTDELAGKDKCIAKFDN